MLLSNRQYVVANALVFQASWPLCVIGGSTVALVTTIVSLLFHFAMVQERRTELIFLLCAGAIGFVFDLALLQIGLLESGSAIQPLWMCCLWFLFATTVGYAMHWFEQRLLIAGIFAGVFAPLSYIAGAGLTDIDLMKPTWLTAGLIGCAWAVVLPGLLLLRGRISAHVDARKRREIFS